MKMTLATARVLFTVGLFALSCGGGDGPKEIPQAEACPEAAKAICAKVFSCPSDVVLDLAKPALGGTEANCRTTIQQNSCASFMCTAGQTYHGDKAAMCRDQFASVTCSQVSTAILTSGGNVNAGIMTLAPTCNQVCS
jgi:hypothetical protein